MTHTEQLRRALRAYDIAGPETPERAAALAAVLSAAHGICDQSNDVPPADLEGWPGSPTPELPTPSWADLIDSALLLALVFFILYTLDNASPF